MYIYRRRGHDEESGRVVGGGFGKQRMQAAKVLDVITANFFKTDLYIHKRDLYICKGGRCKFESKRHVFFSMTCPR